MAVTPKTLFEAKEAENAQTTQYTSPSGGKGTIVDKFTGTNKSAGAVTLTVNIVASAGAAGTANVIVAVKSLAVNECYTFPELVGQVLNPGDFISTLASAVTAINIRASGRELT